MLSPVDRLLVKLQLFSGVSGPDGSGPDDMYDEDGVPTYIFTCDECDANDRCEFAFDEWNRQGDCLAEK